MAGAIAIVVVLLTFPILVGIGSAAIAAALGQSLSNDGAARNAGSELNDLNV